MNTVAHQQFSERLPVTHSGDVIGNRRTVRPSRPTIVRRPVLFGIGLAAATVLTVLGTLYALSGDPGRLGSALPILSFNLILTAGLAIWLGLRVIAIFRGSDGEPAPILHRRFVAIFSAAALVPAILVGIFATSLISKRVNEVFGEDVRETIVQVQDVLGTYVNQELEDLVPDVGFSRQVLQANRDILGDRITFTHYVQRLVRERGLDSLYVIARDGTVLTRVENPSTPAFRVPSPEAFALVEQQGVAFQSRDDVDYLMALSVLDGYDDAYVYLGRFLRSNQGILSSISDMRAKQTAFDTYDRNIALINRVFALTFLEGALIMLMVSILLGVFLANQIITPLGRLISAADRIRLGDMGTRVDVGDQWAEVSSLGLAFNNMTAQLDTQRRDLVQAHGVSEQRRQFSEAVLSGVSAGVIGLSGTGRITLVNRSAETLLGRAAKAMVNMPLSEAIPEFAETLDRAKESLDRAAETQVDVDARSFSVRVSAYDTDADPGWVVTFDDMTRVVIAQRQSAWREVARRIAHEIKNPLTPIQLSAERLRAKVRTDDERQAKIVDNCTDTIIRSVGNLEMMVDEFSNFARMPEPEIQRVDLVKLVRRTVAELRLGFADIDITFSADTKKLMADCDARLIGQALTNLGKNAAESVLRRMEMDDRAGRIRVALKQDGERAVIEIVDNGVGWPADRLRVLEPYFTTRKSGTGLGLAIVDRIIKDHGGEMSLLDREANKPGARLRLNLPISANLGANHGI